MSKKSLHSLIGFSALAGTVFGLSGTPQGSPEPAALERYLRTARIINIAVGASGGRNEPWVVRLTDGQTERNGFFKYQHRPRPNIASVSYKRELAAYELTKILGIDIVPPAVERKITDKTLGTRTGSLQIFLEGCITESVRRREKLEPPRPKEFSDALDEIAVFENLTSCPRDDPGDIMIHRDTWKVCRVDFMEAFNPVARLLPRAALVRCSKRLYASLSAVDPKALGAALKPYLDANEIEALLERRRLILEELGRTIKEKGEAAVLF